MIEKIFCIGLQKKRYVQKMDKEIKERRQLCLWVVYHNYQICIKIKFRFMFCTDLNKNIK
jgi:hypothetical protein